MHLLLLVSEEHTPLESMACWLQCSHTLLQSPWSFCTDRDPIMSCLPVSPASWVLQGGNVSSSQCKAPPAIKCSKHMLKHKHRRRFVTKNASVVPSSVRQPEI